MREQRGLCLGREGQAAASGRRRGLVQAGGGEDRHILWPLVQRWDPELHYRKPPIEITPEATLGDPCGQVFPVSRTVAAAAPLRPTLEALLAGPSAAEQALGYEGWFSAETEGLLRDVRVDSGVAHVDLEAQLRTVIPNASTSCGSAGLLAQLDQTVTQFPTVIEPRYSLGGDEAAFYEWLQLVPPT